MDRCILISHPEFVALAKEANINPLILKSKVGVWQEKNNTNEFPTISQINLDSTLPKSNFSTKENPSIIPFNNETKALYEHYKLLNNDGNVKLFITQAEYKKAKEWIDFNNEHAKGYSFILRKQEVGYRIFIANEFNKQGNLFRPVFHTAPRANEDNYLAYYNFKDWLYKNLKKKFEDYKIQNVAIKDTDIYKAKIKKFFETQNRLEQELKNMNVTDANLVFADFIYEMDELAQYLKDMSPDEYATFNVGARLETLKILFTGTDNKGEIYYTDENRKKAYIPIDGEGFENFSAIIKKLHDLSVAYEQSYETITRKIIETNPIHQANMAAKQGKELNEYMESFEKLFADRKDVNILEQFFLGINSVNDSASATALNLQFQYAFHKAQQSVVAIEDRIKKSDLELSRQKFDMDNFFEKDEHRIDTGNIIHIYSRKWFKGLYEFSKRKDEFRKPSQGSTRKKGYADVVNWLQVNSHVIDFTKIAGIKDIYEDTYGNFFTTSNKEMADYEESLRNSLGRYYDTMIEELKDRLETYQDYRMTTEFNGGDWVARNVLEKSPWEFVKRYYSEGKYLPAPVMIGGEMKATYVSPDYITFIPQELRSKSYGTEDTGFFNKDFDEIQKNETAYKYWEDTKDIYSKHTNPILSTKGRNIGTMSWGKFLQDSMEVLRTKDGNPLVSKIANELWKRTSEVFQDTRSNRQSEEQVSRNYTDTSKAAITKLKGFLQFKTIEELENMIKERAIYNFIKPTKKSKEEEYKKEIIDVIARNDVLSMYSKDLTKMTLALSSLASLHRARVETANVTELLLSYNEQTRDEKGEKRVKSNTKQKSWVNVNIYNKRSTESTREGVDKIGSFGRILSDADKKIKKVLETIKDPDGDFSFSYNDMQYVSKGGKYTVEENSVDELEGKVISTITKEKMDEVVATYLEEEVRKLGLPITVHSIWNAVLKSIAAKGMLLNPRAGVFNRLEGTVTNMIRDSEGSFWKSGNLGFAKRDMTGVNVYMTYSDVKLMPEALKQRKQLETFIQLFERLGVFEDRKNELDRRDNSSRFKKLAGKLDPYKWAVGFPEFKNQGEIVHCMLQDFKITDTEGITHDFYDKKTGEWTAFIPGTTQLKEEFRTAENLFWENIPGQATSTDELFVAKARIDDVIKKTQGNYSKLDSIQVQDGMVGRSLMLFMRWLPEHAIQRFGKRDNDIIQGKATYIGRFHALYSNLPALGIFATALTFGLAGPSWLMAMTFGGSLVIPFIMKQVMKNKLNFDKSLALNNFNLLHTAGMLQEAIVQSLNFPFKMAHATWAIKPMFKKISIDNLISDENSGLSEAEGRALKGMAQEVANLLSISIALFIAKAMLKGMMKGADDDDDETGKKNKRQKELTYFYNFVSNSGHRLITAFTAWSTPNTFMDQNGKLSAIVMLNDVVKLVKMMWKGTSKTEDVLYQIQRIQPIIPLPNSIASAVFKGNYPFFESRDYNPGDWQDRALMSASQRAKAEAENLRMDFKDNLIKEYEEQLKDSYKAYKQANPDFVMPDNDEIASRAEDKAMTVIRRTYKKKGEKQEKTLERLKATKNSFSKRPTQPVEEDVTTEE